MTNFNYLKYARYIIITGILLISVVMIFAQSPGSVTDDCDVDHWQTQDEILPIFGADLPTLPESIPGEDSDPDFQAIAWSVSPCIKLSGTNFYVGIGGYAGGSWLYDESENNVWYSTAYALTTQESLLVDLYYEMKSGAPTMIEVMNPNPDTTHYLRIRDVQTGQILVDQIHYQAELTEYFVTSDAIIISTTDRDTKLIQIPSFDIIDYSVQYVEIQGLPDEEFEFPNFGYPDYEEASE